MRWQRRPMAVMASRVIIASLSSRRAAMAISAPSRARERAVAAPIPRVPPVTSAIFPDRFMSWLWFKGFGCAWQHCSVMSKSVNIGKQQKAESICYRVGSELNLEQVLDLYKASTLGERRPIEDRERFAAMLRHANL